MRATNELSLQNLWHAASPILPPWLQRAQTGTTPHAIIFERGNLKLLKYKTPASAPRQRHPIVIIPSLINRHYILDLLPQKSLVEAFTAQGFETYMLAWGHPPAEDRYLTIDNLFRQRILKAIDLAAKETGQVHLVGQCLGGTLATMAALKQPESIASLSLLTAPMNFEHSGQLGQWAKTENFDVDALVEAYGNVPATLLHTSFQFLKPSMPFTKYKKLFSRRKDEEFVVNFIAMEMWANDVISFPGLCYKYLIEELYRKNTIDTSALKMPILDAMAVDDHIVPIESRILNSTKRIDLQGGHIGGVIGAKARAHFWPEWIEWLKNA